MLKFDADRPIQIEAGRTPLNRGDPTRTRAPDGVAPCTRRVMLRASCTVILLSAFSIATGQAARMAPVDPANPAIVTATLVDLTNAERIRAGVSPVEADAKLSHAAQLEANQLADIGQFAHVLPDAPYPTPPDRLAAADYRWRSYGENIASGHRADVVMRRWMESPGHRANILSEKFTGLGIGYGIASDGLRYYVQLFGRPDGDGGGARRQS